MSKLSIAVFLAIIGVSLAAGGCRIPKISYGYCEPVMVDYMPRSYIPYGTVVKCHCEPGYEWTEKSNSYECDPYGWQPSTFGECVKLTCPYREPPENGDVTPSQKRYSVNQKIEFSCLPGYSLSGNSEDKCKSNGKWAVNKPVYCLKQCKVENLAPYVTYSPEAKYHDQGTEIYFKCDKSHYHLVGEGKSKCSKGGIWDTDFPICVRKCYTPEIENGGVEDEKDFYLAREYIEYFCNDGYVLDGEDEGQCLGNGEWSHVPTCKVTCPYREPPENGDVTPSQKRYFVNQKIEFSCLHGYSLSGNSGDKCESNGKWAVNKPVYCLKQCKVENMASYVTYSPEAKYYNQGTEIFFKCDESDYHLVGEEKSKCSKSGIWDTDFPICVRKCYTPEIEDGGVGDEKDFYLAREYIEYFCNDGYVLDGEDEGQCLGNGEWSHVPTCKAQCKRPTKPNKGSFEPYQDYYAVGANTTFKCEEDYELMGERVLTCQDGGEWDYHSPKCQRTCPYREPAENGEVTPSQKRYSVRQEIKFTCLPGYSLSGNSKDKCKSNGRWAVNKPVYCLKQCKVGNLAPYVTYSPEAKYHDQGTKIYFKCDKSHYHLVGEGKSKCSEGGSWDTDFPICVRKCYTPEIENGGVEDEKDFYLAREYIEYFCNDGYVLDGEDEGQCLGNGEWSHVPTCKEIILNDSCYGRCGKKDDYFEYTCQCHYRCEKEYNCCSDYRKQCFSNKHNLY
ncbi:complement receptor type 2-like [Styela clava]